MTILLVIVILVFLILVHELGHFVAAKLFGVRVQEFGIGFPPRALLFGTIGDTEYTLNWIPFGGFVRLYGEQEDSNEHGKGSFMDAPRWKQAVILVAGVTMNLIIAYILFATALMVGTPQVVDQLQPNQQAQLYVSDVLPGSPAGAAGLMGGDQILSVTAPDGAMLDALTPDGLVAFVSQRAGEPLTVTFETTDFTKSTVTVIPANGVNPQDGAQPAIGIGVVLVSTIADPPLTALEQALYITGDSLLLVVQNVWMLISTAVLGSLNLNNVSGPIGLYWVIGGAQQSGAGLLIDTVALISLSLAVVNLLPIPALDGGKMFVLLVEAVMRKRAPRLAIQLLDTIGVALIILLMVVVSYHDLATHFTF